MSLCLYSISSPQISNNKLVADEIAKQSGATVYVPDLFNGDPISPKDFQLKKHTDDSDPQPLEEAFKNFGAWLDKGHKPDSSDPIFKKVLAEVGRKGPVVTSGACYGGRLSANAAQQPNGIVKGAIMNHPALLEKGEADKVQVPVLLNMSETDVIFTDEIKQDWLDVLKKKNLLDSGSKTYKGAVHGHTCRPDLTKPEIKAAYEQSLQASAEFIKKIFA